MRRSTSLLFFFFQRGFQTNRSKASVWKAEYYFTIPFTANVSNLVIPFKFFRIRYQVSLSFPSWLSS